MADNIPIHELTDAIRDILDFGAECGSILDVVHIKKLADDLLEIKAEHPQGIITAQIQIRNFHVDQTTPGSHLS